MIRARAGGRLGRIGQFIPAVTVLVVAVVGGAVSSPYFLDIDSLFFHTGRYVEVGLLALALTVVIVHGDIDLSVASNLAFSAAVLGLSYQAGLPIWAASLAAIVTGAVLGAVNGLIVTLLGVPSLVVTLGTLALYRGLAQIALGDQAITGYPIDFIGSDTILVIGPVPLPLVLLLIAAVLFWVLLERSTFGLRALLIGSNRLASTYTGIRTDFNRFLAFTLAGSLAGVSAVLVTSRLGSTRSNLALGLELLVITVVVLGGTDIFGGRGTTFGTLLALFAVMAVREALAINNVNGQVQDAVIGFVLIVTVAVPLALARRRSTRKTRATAPTEPQAAAGTPPIGDEKGTT
jgi:rhamnose transport system permease protein